jgi:hypothetical protein
MAQLMGKFEGYILRAIEEADYKKLQEWIAADPAHAGLLDPEFFMGEGVNGQGEIVQDPRVTVFALADRKETLMYVRLTRASRVHIQFPPMPPQDGGRDAATALHKARKGIANALVKGMAYLEVALERAGATEWIFETESNTLRNLAQKRMGFAPSPHELVRVIPRVTTDHVPETLDVPEEDS